MDTCEHWWLICSFAQSYSVQQISRGGCYSDQNVSYWLFSHWSSSMSLCSVLRSCVLPCTLIDTILLLDCHLVCHAVSFWTLLTQKRNKLVQVAEADLLILREYCSSKNLSYSLACPTVATPHKFHTSFWQVLTSLMDRMIKSPRKTDIESDQQPSNLSETCQKLVQNLCGHGWTRKTVSLV